MSVNNAKNLSLQKKSAARVAAIQTLYKHAITKEELDPAQQLITLRVQLHKNAEEQKMLIGAAVEPNYVLYEAILTGVDAHRKDIEKAFNAVLAKDWKRERMSPVLIAILQCATFELLFHKDVNLKVIQDEYCRITRSFFGEAEVNFIFAATTAMSEQYE